LIQRKTLGSLPAHYFCMANILLVVPDTDLRKSLEFALRAEGYEVTWSAGIGAAETPSAFACTVLDHDAIGADLAEGRAFCEAFWPVILLSNASVHPLASSAFASVLKPQLGPALINATRAATAAREGAT